MSNVINALLNMILVSIPEELFLTMMTLIFLKRFDLLDVRMWKHNIKWIMIPALPIALMINLFRYIVIIPKPLMTIINLIIFYLLLIYIIKKTSFNFIIKDYTKILVSFSLSFIIWGILESITCPLILYLMNKPIEFFNNNFLWNLMFSIPSRIFGYILIIYLVIRHNNIIKIKLFEVIFKNNFMSISIISFAILSNVFAVYILKLIGINKILEDKISLIEQMLITMSVLILPAIILFYILIQINFLLIKERQIHETYKNLVIQDDITFNVDE